jgi:hypothetical protein
MQNEKTKIIENHWKWAWKGITQKLLVDGRKHCQKPTLSEVKSPFCKFTLQVITIYAQKHE